MGLSPLTRGNPQTPGSNTAAEGPIPAHAGEPVQGFDLININRAYPRSRGGTAARANKINQCSGLSPLTRGNRDDVMPKSVTFGPIPAHAGEPLSRGAAPHLRGLSPLTRGNHERPQESPVPDGPIPAHAGEPKPQLTAWCAYRAYPRSRGGTFDLFRSRAGIGGLSPLTRGNLGQALEAAANEGPIPAHAGEPHPRRAAQGQAGAYPRSRGGTFFSHPIRAAHRGPIPAHAGEPP